MSTHTISLIVENHSGALSRIAGLFSSRGYNISSIAAGTTEDPTVSHVTIVVTGDKNILEQVVKQLNRLVDVIKVKDFRDEPVIDRELMLTKVRTTAGNRQEILTLINTFNGKIASASTSSIIVEMTGTSQTIDNFITLVRPYGIKELIRSGRIAMAQAKN
jgi:acetolactate synthase-1/3 small subunit